MSANTPCVLIYNPISGHGHLDSWTALFVAALLGAGWRVNIATPDSSDLMVRLQRKNYASAPNLHILNWNASRQSLWQRAIGRLRRALKLSGSPIQEDIDPRYLDPYDLGLRIATMKRKSKWHPSIVLNMYMDMYAPDPKRWSLFEAVNPLPWVGIRFVPSPTGTEAYYQLPSNAGMCFLDNDIRDRYESLFPHKSFAYLPDITESALPETRSELVRQIQVGARERKVVFLGGTIGGNKNLSRWYQLIALADPNQWYFVQIGELFEDTLSDEDAHELARINETKPENLFIKQEYLPDEAAFNEVIAISDVIFAAYRNFAISSNMPGKAAAFEKPILASEGYLMGDRVTEYGIGLAVPENDVNQMYAGLIKLTDEKLDLKNNFASYRQAFSVAALTENLVNVLQIAIGNTRASGK